MTSFISQIVSVAVVACLASTIAQVKFYLSGSRDIYVKNERVNKSEWPGFSGAWQGYLRLKINDRERGYQCSERTATVKRKLNGLNAIVTEYSNFSIKP